MDDELSRNWKVIKLPERSYRFSATMKIPEWMNMQDRSGVKISYLWTAFIDAMRVLFSHEEFKFNPSAEPRVGYDIVMDDEYFIFAADEGDSVFVVGPMVTISAIESRLEDEHEGI